jgi:hypothetical protein
LANISVHEIALHCHPLSDPGGITDIQVALKRGVGGSIDIKYRVSGTVDLLDIPAPTIPNRTDGLWENTCFELFTKYSKETFYLEYNFAPSGKWAAYQFDDYRVSGGDGASSDPVIQTESDEGQFTLSASVILPDGWRVHDLLVGVSAVILTKSGEISYWAAAHPPGKPDFHHRDCFALQLEAPSAA